MRLLLATGNENKKREASEILAPLGIELVMPKELGVDFDVEETGATFAENAMLKAEYGYRKTGLGTIADDSGLCVNALGGRPGVYSARYAGEQTPFSYKIAKLLEELSAQKDRSAYFICAIACILPDKDPFVVEGVCRGEIAEAPSGTGGFGYDPIFRVSGPEKTFSELTPEEKNEISHRGRALAALRERLEENL